MKKNLGASYGLKVSTGNHARIIGILYRCITEATEPEGLDHDVIVEEDVKLHESMKYSNKMK